MRNPRSGVLVVFLCAVTCLIWALAVYGTYEDSKREMVDVVGIKPGIITYGTHSSAVIPVMDMPHSVAPMVSGTAVQHYAHYGHAAMPATRGTNASAASVSEKGLYSTSSVQVQNVGSARGYANGRYYGENGINSVNHNHANRGINYRRNTIVHMPTLAYNTTRMTSGSAYVSEIATAPQSGGLHRAKPDYDGYDGEEVVDDEDGTTIWTYSEGAEDWFNTTPVGTTRYDATLGYMVEWNGSEWVKVQDIHQPTPLGPTPWILMLLLAVAYVAKKRKTVLSSVNK